MKEVANLASISCPCLVCIYVYIFLKADCVTVIVNESLKVSNVGQGRASAD